MLEAYLSASAAAGGPHSEDMLKAFVFWAAPDDQHVAFKRSSP